MAAPDLIVNATAYTIVDRAESEPDQAYAINVTAIEVNAEEARDMDTILIDYSTDYVFDGKKGESYIETDIPDPLNVYGASKLAGQRTIQAIDGAHPILRRKGFVNMVLEWARNNETLQIEDDQVSNPTWARVLAEATTLLTACGKGYLSERRGLYHLAGSGHASRYEWAKRILELDPNPGEQVTRRLQRTTKRPLYSALDCSKFERVFGVKLPVWQQALEMAMASHS